MDNVEERYNLALDYLYSFVDFSLQKAASYSPARFKLERMEELAASLGNPQRQYPIIHVAGTKGKGSVSILCASALQQAGYKVGLYTSPHLDDYAERIQVDGQFIPHTDLADMVEAIKAHVAAIPELTTFEITTALAFWYFARQCVNAAVIEVGLGGRLDATNVVLPEVSVITSISYDHMQLLGNSLAEIAGEKAGIIKPGVPVVCAPQVEEARLAIERIASERSAPLIQVGTDVAFEPISHSFKGQTLRVWHPGEQKHAMIDLTIPLLGMHQVANAATAFTALEIFYEKGHPLSQKDIETGFQKAFWPGRFEIVQTQPPIVLDCAHNRDSAQKLAATVEEYFPGKKLILLFGASEDKDITGMLAELMPHVDELIVVKSFHPRAADPEKLMEMAASYQRPIHVLDHIPQALEKAITLTNDSHLLLVTGSIFVVAEARKVLQPRTQIRSY